MSESILIIDDDLDFIKEIEEMLENCGYVTQSFTSGEEMLKTIDSLAPHLILLDLKMKDMSGFKIAGEIRSNRKFQNIPIIALTGYYNCEEFNVTMRLKGIDVALVKPVEPLVLIKEIEENIKIYRNNNEKEYTNERAKDIKMSYV